MDSNSAPPYNFFCIYLIIYIILKLLIIIYDVIDDVTGSTTGPTTSTGTTPFSGSLPGPVFKTMQIIIKDRFFSLF